MFGDFLTYCWFLSVGWFRRVRKRIKQHKACFLPFLWQTTILVGYSLKHFWGSIKSIQWRKEITNGFDRLFHLSRESWGQTHPHQQQSILRAPQTIHPCCAQSLSHTPMSHIIFAPILGLCLLASGSWVKFSGCGWQMMQHCHCLPNCLPLSTLQ